MSSSKDRESNVFKSIKRLAIAGGCTAALIVIYSSLSASTGSSATQLAPATQQAMIDAINDEYLSRASYSAVINKFGEVRPFSNIVWAEDTHASILTSLFVKYGLPVPQDAYAGRVKAPNTIKAACEEGIKGEIANIEMYDRFLTYVKEPDLRSAFAQLRQASQENHLPAFTRCANRR